MLRPALHPPRGHFWSAASAFQRSEAFHQFSSDDTRPPPAYDLDSGPADGESAERAAKRRRVEILANDLINGKELFISSARPRNPFPMNSVSSIVALPASRDGKNTQSSGSAWKDVMDDAQIIRNAKRPRRDQVALQGHSADDHDASKTQPSEQELAPLQKDQDLGPRSKRIRTAEAVSDPVREPTENATPVRARSTRRAVSGSSKPLQSGVVPTAASSRLPRQSSMKQKLLSGSHNEEAPKATGAKRRAAKRKPQTASQDPEVDVDDDISEIEVRNDASTALAKFRSSAGYGAQFASTYIEGGDPEVDDAELEPAAEPAITNGTSASTKDTCYHTAPEQTSQVSVAPTSTDDIRPVASIEPTGSRRQNTSRRSGNRRDQSATDKAPRANRRRQGALVAGQTPADDLLQPPATRETQGLPCEGPQPHDVATTSRVRQRSIGEIVRIAQLSQASETMQSSVPQPSVEHSQDGNRRSTASPMPAGFAPINPLLKHARVSPTELEEKGHTPPPMNEEQASMMGSFSIHDASQPSAAAMSMLGLEYGKNRKLQRAKTTGAPSVSNPGRPEGWVPCHPGRGPMSQNDPRRAIDPKLPRGQQQRMTAFRIELNRPKPLYTATSPAPNEGTPFKYRRRTDTPEAGASVAGSPAEPFAGHETEEKEKKLAQQPKNGKRKGRRVTYPSADADDKERRAEASQSPIPASNSTPAPPPLAQEREPQPQAQSTLPQESKPPSRETSSSVPSESNNPPLIGRIVKDAQGNNVIETPIPVAKPFVEMELDFNDSFGRDLNIALNERHVNSILKDRGPGDSAAAVRERLRRELLMSGAVITDATSQASVFPMYDPNSPVLGKYRAMINKTATPDRAAEPGKEPARRSSSVQSEGSKRRSNSRDHASAPSQAWPGTQVLLRRAEKDLMSSPVKTEQNDNDGGNSDQAVTTPVADSSLSRFRTFTNERAASTPGHEEPAGPTQQMFESWSPWSSVKKPRAGQQQSESPSIRNGKSIEPASPSDPDSNIPKSTEPKRDDARIGPKTNKRARRQSNLRFSTTTADSPDRQENAHNPTREADREESPTTPRSPPQPSSAARSSELANTKHNTASGTKPTVSGSARGSSSQPAETRLKDDSQLTQTMSELAGTVLQNGDMEGVMSQL